MEFITRLFDHSDFTSRWQSGSGWKVTPWLGWLHVWSDLAIWSACLATLVFFAVYTFRRMDLSHSRCLLLFGICIFAIGTTQLMEAVMFWWPAYRLAGLIKLMTAIVSWVSLVVLVPQVTRGMAIRSQNETEREIAARKRAEHALQQVNAELERRVQQRTADLTLAADALREERELLRTTLRSIGDGVVVTDTRGHVTFLNGVAEKLTGWTTAEAKGLPLEQVFQIVNDFSRKSIENPAETAIQEGTVIGLANHTILISKDRTELPIDQSAAPIRGEAGGVRGAVVVFRDITERKRVLTKLRDQEERLRLAIEATGLGIFDYSPQTGHQDWSDRCKQIWGLAPNDCVPTDIVVKVVQANDRNAVKKIIDGSRDPVDQDEFVVEHRLLNSNGSERWILVRGKTIFEGTNGQRRPVRSLGTMLDITDRKQAEQALKEADRRKDEFLAILAHELRNPLAPIRNSLELMKHSGGDNQLIEMSRSTMERQLTQLIRLVDDLIDVSRISRNKLHLRKETVDFASIIECAVETCRSLAESANHTLTISLPSQPVLLHADAVRMSQVFGNLLTNSCKYTGRGGQISLTAERQGDELLTKIRDSGVGIPSDKLNDVFEMFTQVDRNLERTQGGLGIGLTLVKRLVEMHDGTVTAFSEGPGKGSEFVVRLPIVDELPDDQLKSDAPFENITITSRRILVVDDNLDSAITLEMLLKLKGHEVHTAHDGEEAVQMAESARPELILLDIGLPKLNGYGVCQKIRQTPWGKKIFIVALTGWGQEEDRRKTKEAGFNGHLVKPIDQSTLAKLFVKIDEIEQRQLLAGGQ